MPTTYNKVTAGGNTLIDLSQDTVTQASHIMAGYVGHLADGTQVTGTGSGGGAVEEKQVNFIDYDGTILHSYTKAEANALTELPSNPSHTGLTAQGWNWSLQQIKAQLTANPNSKVWIGQNYVTQSGDTEIDVHFTDASRLKPTLTVAVNGTITVDWGDGTSVDTITGSSLTSRSSKQHTYSNVGDYTIIIHVSSGSFRFYNSSDYTILRKNTTGNENCVYASTIRSVRLGSGITSIADHAFYNCFQLESVTIPTTIASVEEYAFYYCYTLKAAIIPSGVTTIGNRAFNNCGSLLSVSLPSSITSIGQYAFNNCYSLMHITIPNGTATISQYAFGSCYSLREITIPGSVTSLSNYAIYLCYSATSIELVSGITSIGEQALNNCRSLASLTIPSTVTSIGANGFSGCNGIGAYHFLRTSPPSITSNTFTNISSDCIIYVPYSADHSVLNAYKGASNWSSQSRKIQEEPQ